MKLKLTTFNLENLFNRYAILEASDHFPTSVVLNIP